MADEKIDEFNASQADDRGAWGGEVRTRENGDVHLNLYSEPENGARQEFSAEMRLPDAERLRDTLTRAIRRARAAGRGGGKK